ncbi:hypothetical protein [Luteococcus japonicus]|nr:hypothetical protein [Luteococcus japonicus]
MESMGIADLASKLPITLSGGEQQRVARDPGQCVLMVTHDPVVARRCDRVAFMRLAGASPPAERGRRKGMVGRVIWCLVIAALMGLIFWATPTVRTMDDEKFALQSVMQATFFLLPCWQPSWPRTLRSRRGY